MLLFYVVIAGYLFGFGFSLYWCGCVLVLLCLIVFVIGFALFKFR